MMTEPLKAKSGNEATKAIAKITRDDGRYLKNLHIDRGKEFYNSDVQKLLMKQARLWEDLRDEAQEKAHYLGWAEVLLQLSIILASISMLSTSKKMLGLAVVFAFFGVLMLVNGMFLLVNIPFALRYF